MQSSESRERQLDRMNSCLPTSRLSRLSGRVPTTARGGCCRAKAQKTEPPPMYQVILLNDDYTPMEFVVMVLQEYFNRDLETATQIMLKIHHDGRGVCGVYSKDVAGTKVELVLAAARRGGHPLQCIMESA
jgi:ATP-dependent Clp protease adaptor protein ClpS